MVRTCYMFLSLGIGLCGATGAAAGEAPRGWPAVLAESVPVTVEAVPVVIGSGELSGLVLEGAWALRSDSPDFGGLSGLVIDGGVLYAASDRGRWFSASLAVADGTLRLEDAALAPMRGANGEALDKITGDAEGLTLVGGSLAVSFERNHRIMTLGASGRLEEQHLAGIPLKFPENEGLEALATLPDGRLIALAENTDGVEIPMIILDLSDGGIAEEQLQRRNPHVATGADLGPDGRLYLLARRRPPFLWRIFGSSVRITRYRLGPNGFPLDDSVEVLATFAGNSSIDNLEGLAIQRGPSGNMHLWLIADDNFSNWERSLLLRFKVLQ